MLRKRKAYKRGRRCREENVVFVDCEARGKKQENQKDKKGNQKDKKGEDKYENIYKNKSHQYIVAYFINQ